MKILLLFSIVIFFSNFLFSGNFEKNSDEASFKWFLNGKYYYNLKKDIPKAVSCLKKSLDLNPENEKARELLFKIQKENNITDLETSSQRVDFTQKGQSFQWYVNANYLYKKGQVSKAFNAVKNL